MHAPKTRTLTTAVTADQLFEAVLRTVDNGKYALTPGDAQGRQATFTSGKTALSWGQEYVASVEPAGEGSTLTLVCGGLDGAPKALLDGWKNSKAADKFLEGVQAHLTQP